MKELLFEFCPARLVGNATSMGDAVELIQRHEPDVVILDIDLGPAADQTGLDLLRFLRKVFPTINVMILTNHTESSYQVLCEDLGVDHFLDKSHDFDKIPETLLEMFDLKATGPS